MRRGAHVGLLVVSLVVTACGAIPPSPTTAAPVKAEVIATRITLMPSPGELPIGGGTTSITIGVSGGGGSVAAPARAVHLTASGGVLDHQDVVTDLYGYATVIWKGTESATLTATAGELSSTIALTVRVPYVAPPTPPPTNPRPTPPAPPPPATPPSPPGQPPPPASCNMGPYEWDPNPSVLRCRNRSGQFAPSACCGR